MIGLDDLAFCADDCSGKKTRKVQIELGIKRLLVEDVEGVDRVCVRERNVRVAHVLTHHAGILAFGERVIWFARYATSQAFSPPDH